MDTPGRTGISRGFKAVKSVLDRFGVSNRKDMFVYKDSDGAVFYFRWVFCFSKAAFKLWILCHMVSQPACRRLLFSLGSFSIDDGNGSKNVAFAKNSRFSNTVAFIPICWKWQMWANFPRVDFLKSALNFIERKRNSSSLVYVLHKTSNRPFYSYGWKRGWRWPCFDTNLSALLCK